MKEFKSFFKTVSGGEGDRCKYPTRLDTYGCGCFHDCAYCYAKSLLSFRGLWNPENPSVANPDKIKRKIEKLEAGSIIRLCGMTDCFQPAESKFKTTLKTIQALNKRKVGYLIVTKSHLVADDEYIEAMDKSLAHIQISISCTNDNPAKTYEKCSLVSKRLDAVKKLSDAGFDVSLRISPFIPEFVDLSVIAENSPRKILVEFLRVNHWIEKWLDGRVDLDPYSLKCGGYRHMPLEKKIELIKNLKSACPRAEISVCEDVDDHYKYWVENVNPNKHDCCNLTM